MKSLEKIKIVSPETDKDDQRIGSFLGSGLEKNEGPKAVIVGFPSDEGVRRNGGRPGAAMAPNQIRNAWYKMTPAADQLKNFINLVEHTNDIGNVKISGNLEADQDALAHILAPYIRQNIIPIILGGGHETAFGHFLGYAKAHIKTAILNIDAHADVRPLKKGQSHSGSSFRQAIEHESECCQTYSVAGLQPYSVARSHLKFIEDHCGKYCFKDETIITTISQLLNDGVGNRIMVTFDMDAVDQAFAPGVSAPCVNGLTPEIWLTAAYLAGRSKRVSSFDISEVNPGFDRDGQTAKLAALTIWHFLLGLSQRE